MGSILEKIKKQQNVVKNKRQEYLAAKNDCGLALQQYDENFEKITFSGTINEDGFLVEGRDANESLSNMNNKYCVYSFLSEIKYPGPGDPVGTQIINYCEDFNVEDKCCNQTNCPLYAQNVAMTKSWTEYNQKKNQMKTARREYFKELFAVKSYL